MAPRIHLVRHGQGYHQLEPLHESRQCPDPELTNLGVLQCKALNTTFPEYFHIDLICASPMRRTILTAKYCFASTLERTAPILLQPLAQEDTDEPCDVGSAPDALKKEFGDLIDTSLVKEGWNSKKGIYAPTPEALRDRARQLRRWLRLCPEKEVVVVGHGTFFQYVIGDVDGQGHITGMCP